MRLDKYLKVSRIIKRRTLAKDFCDANRVLINERVVRASYEVKLGDIIQINFGNSSLKAEIIDIKEHVRKEDSKEMYKVITE
ncbi:MAG: RNA-binding protein [Clostridiales bacterium GWE2_32_10]|nr:MAG: RNA-binding protein [Clostridiales bacterium GWE2_32_10]HBY20268.1 RNA-binding protein [Clostridiales bacterium]